MKYFFSRRLIFIPPSWLYGSTAEGKLQGGKTMDTTTTIAALIQQGMDANPEATRAVLMGIQLGFSLAALEETKKAG